MTWSIVEQGIGIVCACLPTLRPLLGFIMPTRSRSNTKNNNSIGMDKYPTGAARSDIGSGAKSSWMDTESTVGFARLKDDDHAMSPAELQRSVYAPIGNAVSTPGGGSENHNTHARIMKEQTIEQHSEIVR